MKELLPGYDLISTGLEDLACNRQTVQSLLVSIGAPKLRVIGLPIPEVTIKHPEHKLYDLLAEENSDNAHSRYNALIRRLVSFERAAQCVKK